MLRSIHSEILIFIFKIEILDDDMEKKIHLFRVKPLKIFEASTL